MNREIKISWDALRSAIEQFGSLAHLANAIGVTYGEFVSWLNNPGEMPRDKFERMIEAVASL